MPARRAEHSRFPFFPLRRRAGGARAWRALPTLRLLGLLLAVACQPNPTVPPAPTPMAAPPTIAPRPAAASPEPASSPRPFGGLPIQDPFPAATTTVAGGQALLWTPWAMEGRDPQRSGRSPVVGAQQPRLLWSAPIDEPSVGQAVFAADGSVLVGTASGKVQSFGADGKPGWTFSAAGGPVPSPAIGPDGSVYARGGDGSLYALRADGRRRWTTDIGAPPAKLGPAPLVGPDRYVYLGSYQSSLVYLVQPGGFFQWAYNAHARILGGVAVGAGGLVYFGSADGKLRAVDRELVEQWVVELGDPVVSAPALSLDGKAFVLTGGAAPALVAVDRTGRKLWSVAPCWSGGAPLIWPAVAVDGGAQVGNCAVGPDGRVRWAAAVSGPGVTPAALDGDGNAYFGSGSTITSVGPDGSPRWSFAGEGEVRPPSLGPFGQVAFSTRSPDRLYLLGR